MKYLFTLFSVILASQCYAGAVYKINGHVLLTDMPPEVTEISFRVPSPMTLNPRLTTAANPYFVNQERIFNDPLYRAEYFVMHFSSESGFGGWSEIDWWGLPGHFDLGPLMIPTYDPRYDEYDQANGGWENAMYGDEYMISVSYEYNGETEIMSFHEEIEHSPEPTGLALVLLACLIIYGFRQL